MTIADIKYTAILIDYISRVTDKPKANVVTMIGEYGIKRLCHNAGMNRLLPIHRIAKEVIHDYDIAWQFSESSLNRDVNEDFGETAASAIEATTPAHQDYHAALYKMLLQLN